MRKCVTNKLQTLIEREKIERSKKVTYKTKQEAHEKKLIKNIKKKLTQNNLTVTKSNKENTLVIIHQDDYNQKINEFITNNNFTNVTKDHTKIQQRAIKETINTCSNIIRHTDKWRYVNMNPGAPQIVGTIKLHKENKLIRPTVN